MNKVRLRVKDILTTGLKTNLSSRQLAAFHGVAPNTVRKYLKAATNLGLDLERIQAMGDEVLERTLRASRKRLTCKRLPDWSDIHRQMRYPHVTLGLLWEDYRVTCPEDAYSYSQFTELYRRFADKLNLTMRMTHQAGEVLFVDFAGKTIPYYDSETETTRQAQIFVACLGCSNYAFVYAVRAQSTECWIEAHNRLFQHLGGTTPVICCDNLKAAVIRPGKEFELNRAYREMAKHYGFVVAPARPRRPQDKAKVEACVLFTERWVLACLRHRHFTGLAEINAAIPELLQRMNERPFKRLPGSRLSQFVEFDKPLLKPLPDAPFEYAEWFGPLKVGPDYHVAVANHFYSVPFTTVHELVEARMTANVVEFLHDGLRIASHPRSYQSGGTTTDPKHRAPSHRHYAEQTPEHFLEWAKTIGPATSSAIQYQLTRCQYSLPSQRACATLRSFARVYGGDRLEAACCRAQAIGSLTVKSIRSILQRRLDLAPSANLCESLPLPKHMNLRGPQYYGEGE